MSRIFKLCYTTEVLVKKIFVFIGSRLVEYKSEYKMNDLDNLFKTNPTNKIFNGIFSPEEQLYISENSVDVVFCKEQIHLDDTIETIKKKLLREITENTTDILTSYDEMYLFYKTNKILNPENTYQILTQNKSIELTRERLVQYLLNVDGIRSEEIKKKEIKDIYDYNDFLEIISSFSTANQDTPLMHILACPLGQKFVAVEGTYPYTVNPFNVIQFDKFLERHATDLTTTTNQSLLMEYDDVFNNVIYFCLATDVLESIRQKELAEESSIKIYYPYLHEKEINNLELFLKSKTNLEIESRKLIEDQQFIDKIQNVDLFYNIFNGKVFELAYLENGIKNINIILHPVYSFNLPLDVVFKLIHATKFVPFIQYNPGKRQEKIYRLYADKVATNGKKIPHLPKGTVFRLIKSIDQGKKVSVYIEYISSDTDELIPITLSFTINGGIEISASFSNAKKKDEVSDILKNSCNDVITIIKDYLSQSGYNIELFEQIGQPNIEIINIDYEIKIPITKKIQFNNMIRCLSSIFNVIKSDVMSESGATLRFKRVSNYNEMDSLEAFIIEKINSGSRDIEIIQSLVDNFNCPSQEKAREKLVSFVSSLQVVQSAYENKKLKIKNNPGFLTTMIMERFESNIIINVTSINHPSYLETIPIYLDSLLRMTQDTETISEIEDKCKGKKIEEEKKVNDIFAPAEKLQPDGSTMNIQAEELVFEQAEDDDTKDAMLDILLGDYDSDDEDGNVTPTPPSESGGTLDVVGEGLQIAGSDTPDIERNITGMSLSNPNPFSDRLIDREPTLFLTDNEKGFSAYSRICPWNARRQPVILTKEEKEKIDREHPGSYDQFIEYKSNPKGKQFYYICPRYWSLKKNVSLTEDDVKSGDYGNIIPQNAKKVPEGAEIFEFTSKKHTSPDGKYQNMYPGFLKQDKHPEGKCIPCCFQYWDKPEQIKRRKLCAMQQEKVSPEKDVPPLTELDEEGLRPLTAQEEKEVSIPPPVSTPKKQEIKDEYIKGIDKFPLEAGRFGYLPIAIQKFLYTDNKKCQISPTNTNLKQNYPCLLRRGVEINKSQSFVACISEIYSEDNHNIILSIKEMKNVFINALDLDIFISLQNGNLVELFFKLNNETSIQFDDYKSSRFYNAVNQQEPSELFVLKKVISAYENFKKYLNDDEIVIDYHYLWDLVCTPNPRLFDKGLNLAILEISDDDITENVKIICPTNSYSETYFDVNKRTCIIIKNDNYYEPVLILEDKVNKFIITRKFSLKYKDLLPNLRASLDIIKKSLNNGCVPLPSMPKVYNFKLNISLEKLVSLLKIRRYIVETQVLNYNNKVVAVFVNKDDNKRDRGYIPCYPSAPISTLSEYTWIDRVVGYRYEETRNFLTKIYKAFNGKVPCKPLIKVVDDGMIVGILTQTNQFVPIVEPEQDLYGDDLKKIEDINYINVDKTSLTNTDIDNERVKYIKQIKLETSFYNIFRNTIRILLGEQKNKDVRKQLETLVNDTDVPYVTKIRQVDLILRELTENKFIFSEYAENILLDMTNITTCYNNVISKKDNKCNDKSYCLTVDNNCALVIPNKNLINNKDNERIYFGKIADEIIRYSRIRSFIFEPKTYLSLSDINYNLREDEIILLQSLLTQEYFEDLIPQIENKYINTNSSYQTVQPIVTQAYSNILDTIKQKIDDAKMTTCDKPLLTNVSGKWGSIFSSKTKELVFTDSPPGCTFDIILTIIHNDNKENEHITINNVKEILINEYTRLQESYGDNILNILKAEGKSLISRQVLSGQLSLENMIMSDEYYITNLDIWILSRYFKLPIILYSSTKLLENSKDFIILTKDDTNEFYFIKSPSSAVDKIPKYRLIVLQNNIKIPTSTLLGEIGENIKSSQQQEKLVGFIQNFNLAIAKRKKMAAKRLKIIEDPTQIEFTIPKKIKGKKLKLVEK